MAEPPRRHCRVKIVIAACGALLLAAAVSGIVAQLNQGGGSEMGTTSGRQVESPHFPQTGTP
jgi:hypothetical protein